MSVSYNNGTVTFTAPGQFFTDEVISNGITSVLPVTTVEGFVDGDRIELAASVMIQGPIGLPAYTPADAETVLVGVTFFTPDPDFTYAELGDGFSGHSVYTIGPYEGYCLAAGSMIATPAGDRAIEALRAGDLILCHAGGVPTPRTVVDCSAWDYDVATTPRPREAAPIRIAAGAFAEGVPTRALVLSPNHAIHADGMLVPARYLINGLSIVQDFSAATIRYAHVEVASHDLMAAEGLLVETRLPQPAAAAQPMPAGEWSRLWEAQGCAPLVISGPALEALRARLLARAAGLGLSVGGIAPAAA